MIRDVKMSLCRAGSRACHASSGEVKMRGEEGSRGTVEGVQALAWPGAQQM